MPLLVRDLMTADPFTVDPGSDLASLHELMDSKKVRHAPVVDGDGRLRGLVSHRDLVRGAFHRDEEVPLSTMRQMLQTFKVEEVMTPDPETVGSEEEIATAGALMIENKFGCLPVEDGDRLVGILTETDFVRYVVDNAD